MSYLKTIDGKWNIKHLTLISCGVSVIILIIIGIIIYFKEKKSKSSSGNNTTSSSTRNGSNGSTTTSNGSTTTSNGSTTTSNGNTTTSNGNTTTSNGNTTTSNRNTTTSNRNTTTSNGNTTTSIINTPYKIQLIGTKCLEGGSENTNCLSPIQNNMTLSDCYSAPQYTLNTNGNLVNNTDNTKCISIQPNSEGEPEPGSYVIETTCNSPSLSTSDSSYDFFQSWTYDNTYNIFKNINVTNTDYIMNAHTGTNNIIVVQDIEPGQQYDSCQTFLLI